MSDYDPRNFVGHLAALINHELAVTDVLMGVEKPTLFDLASLYTAVECVSAALRGLQFRMECGPKSPHPEHLSLDQRREIRELLKKNDEASRLCEQLLKRLAVIRKEESCE